TLPEIPNFASVFKFDQRVSALESELSELKQTNQFSKVVSLILGIFDMYLASKMKEAVNVGFEQEEEDAHVTLTLVFDTQKVDEPVQSSSVSSNFTSKFLNLENPSLVDNENASLVETSTPYAIAILEITSAFTTTTLTLPEIPNFASVFKFDQRVSALESELSELKQTNQFSKVVSLILGIFDMYLASKMKEAVNVGVQLQTKKFREEAQDENQDFLNQVDSTIKIIIKDQVKEQVSKMMLKIEKGRDDQDKDEDPSDGSDRGTKRRKSGKDVESSKDSRSKEKKSSSTFKYASQSQHKSFGKSVYAEAPSHTVEESIMQQNQEFFTGDNNEQPVDKEVTKADWFKKPERPPTPNPD
nr:hypothetical protein [Tanacetum cinerariifolium]